jgi:hypothetical protein
LADKEPQKLHDLQELFWAEASRNHALPIHDSSADMVKGLGIRPTRRRRGPALPTIRA